MESLGLNKNTKAVAQVVPPLEVSATPLVWQKTLASSVSCTGIGVHSNKPATLTIHPAAADSGYVFLRTDLPEGSRRIPARWDTVTDTSMCTVVSNAHGASVSTIEHVVAALAGCGIHNALLEIDGPEIPIMDGSSSHFVALLEKASVRTQRKLVRTIKVLKPIEVALGKSHAILKPSHEAKFTMHFNANGRLNDQSWSMVYYPDSDDFGDLISAARTFGFYEDAEYLWSKGICLGSSLENAVVIKDGRVMNEEGLRFDDEFIRHKMLDLIGDLALAGAPLLGHLTISNSGHSLNNQLLRALLADETAWSY